MRTMCFAVLLFATAACSTTSISNPGGDRDNPFYFGEISEFDLLGIDVHRPVSEEEIQAAAAAAKGRRLSLPSGARVMLIQSGAPFPDQGMQDSFGREYEVIPFHGSPPPERTTTYSSALRLAAAEGGADAIVCYWGVLEMTTGSLATKGVSWVPIVGSMIPDEARQMRVSMKFVVLDVRTGRWTSFTTTPAENVDYRSDLAGEKADLEQVDELKAKVYSSSFAEFFARMKG